jgi:hypothetical protein
LTLYESLLRISSKGVMSKLSLHKKNLEQWSGREDLNLRPQRPERCALNQTALLPDFMLYYNAQRPERCALNQAALRPATTIIGGICSY